MCHEHETTICKILSALTYNYFFQNVLLKHERFFSKNSKLNYMSQRISSSVGLNLKNVKSDIFWTQITTKFGSKLQVDLLGAGWCGILPKGDWTLILPCIFDMVVFSAEDWWCFTTLIFYQIERCRHIACLHKCSFNLISNNCPLSTFALSKNSTTAIEKQF